MGHRSWHDGRTWARRGLIGVLALAGVGVGIAGSFVHRAGRPAGIALSLAALVAVMVLVRAAARTRWGLGLVGAAWLTPAGIFAAGSSAGDVVIEGDPVGLTFFLGGVAIISLFMGLGSAPTYQHGQQRVPERTPVS